MFSYEEDTYGVVQKDLTDMIKLYLDTLISIEEYQKIPFRHHEHLDFLVGLDRREPSSSVLAECVSTIHELNRIFADDLLDMDLSVRYRSKMSTILATENGVE